MTVKKEAKETIRFVDEYCEKYEEVFKEDYRHLENYKYMMIGMISEIKRKSLPEIAKVVGLKDNQILHHFIANSPWKTADLREKRIELIKQAIGEREIILCIDETGDKKKGKTTDYVKRQYIGNLGKIENGIVAVTAFGVIENITFPITFEIFKPKDRLKEIEVEKEINGEKIKQKEEHKTKIQIAKEMVEEIVKKGFKIKIVLADSEYGEATEFRRLLEKLKLKFVLATRSNHAVWMPKDQYIRYNKWKEFNREFSNGDKELRYIREIVYGKRNPNHTNRYYILTTDKETLPQESTYYIMTNLEGKIEKTVGNIYGLRTWIEYGLKQRVVLQES